MVGCVNRLAWNPTGALLATGSDDRRVRIWDYNTGKCRTVLDTGMYVPICSLHQCILAW
jgi:WD40 repeat protein